MENQTKTTLTLNPEEEKQSNTLLVNCIVDI